MFDSITYVNKDVSSFTDKDIIGGKIHKLIEQQSK